MVPHTQCQKDAEDDATSTTRVTTATTTTNIKMEKMETGPRSLKDLRRGVDTPGDSGNSPSMPPPWFNKHEYGKVGPFFRQHAITLAISWHCSLVIGFALPALLDALVFTDDSSDPDKARARYFATTNIVHELLHQIVLPGIASPPPKYHPTAEAYIDGFNESFPFPLFSITSTLA
eukprot:gene16501-6531_t